jgi:hypothetical protein
MRTARSMTSGEYLIACFFMAPFSQMLGPPRFPGRFSTPPVNYVKHRCERGIDGIYRTDENPSET